MNETNLTDSRNHRLFLWGKFILVRKWITMIKNWSSNVSKCCWELYTNNGLVYKSVWSQIVLLNKLNDHVMFLRSLHLFCFFCSTPMHFEQYQCSFHAFCLLLIVLNYTKAHFTSFAGSFTNIISLFPSLITRFLYLYLGVFKTKWIYFRLANVCYV